MQCNISTTEPPSTTGGKIMRTFALLLLASTSFITTPAVAADVARGAAAETEAEADAAAGEEIVIFGRGETRQVQEVRQADIKQLLPGTSPILAIEKLPSV